MPDRDAKLCDIAAELRHETQGPKSAYLIFDGVREAWLPKSQCQRNDDGTFTMPEWLATLKELI
jgi:hypothetical protein